MLQSMVLQRVGHDWATELNWTERIQMYMRIWELRLKWSLLQLVFACCLSPHCLFQDCHIHLQTTNCKICREEDPNSSGQWNASQVSMNEWRNAKKGNSSISIYLSIFYQSLGLFFLGSKITADGDYNHEMKKCLLLGRKAMTNLDSLLKSRHIALLTKVHLVKAIVFTVAMYGCESWTNKKVECRRIDAFELWCWRRLLRVPWTASRSNQFILKEINSEYSLEGLLLKLKLQYFGHLM